MMMQPTGSFTCHTTHSFQHEIAEGLFEDAAVAIIACDPPSGKGRTAITQWGQRRIIWQLVNPPGNLLVFLLLILLVNVPGQQSQPEKNIVTRDSDSSGMRV